MSDGGRRRTYVVVELIIVTTGILIALSVDGLRQWMGERSLVAEARANLMTEIRDNRKELTGFLQGMAAQRERLSASRETLQRFIDGKAGDGEQLELGFAFPSISDTSRRTAQVTGAFGLMDYPEVRRWESAYSLQETLRALQSEAINGFVATFPTMDPTEASRRELETWKDGVSKMLGSLVIQEQLAKQLLGRYDSALGEATAAAPR